MHCRDWYVLNPHAHTLIHLDQTCVYRHTHTGTQSQKYSSLLYLTHFFFFLTCILCECKSSSFIIKVFFITALHFFYKNFIYIYVYKKQQCLSLKRGFVFLMSELKHAMVPQSPPFPPSTNSSSDSHTHTHSIYMW